MSQSNSSSSSYAQDLLDALIKLRQIDEKRKPGTSDIFRDSGRFKAMMLDMCPEMKKEIVIVSALIDAGFLMRLRSADAKERTTISGQIKVWLDNFGLKAEDAQTYSDVLLAFCNGETKVQIEAPQKKQASNETQTVSKVSQVSRTASSSARVSPPDASRGSSRNYALTFALLVLAAAIFYFSTVMAKDPGLGVSSTEPTGTPAVTQSVVPSASSLREAFVDKKVGECFEFGRYPQGINGEIEPIAWRVLQREADHLLIIAENGLDCKPYNENLCEITWTDCTLRRWLNSEFYEKAFNEQERECVSKTSIVNNAGPNTEDYVFLLSVDEARSFFADDKLRCAKPTGYAVKNDVYSDDGGCSWWLRSRGNHINYASNVYNDGRVIDYGGEVNFGHCAVRPALIIALPTFSGEASPAPTETPAVTQNATSSPEPTGTPAVTQSAVPVVSPLCNIYADKHVGDYFEFGRYPQGANGESKPISWRVLQREADHLLVIAEYGLEYKPFNTEESSTTWANCTLRSWLNSEFYDKAFNEQERECVLQTSIVNNAGPNTEDRVFLLSVDETKSLLANDVERCAEPTEYAVKNGAQTFHGRCLWWLRTRGQFNDTADCVSPNGGLDGDLSGELRHSIVNDVLAVRPVLKLVLPASSGSSSSETTGTPTVAQSAASSASSLRSIYANKRMGDSFEFGRYPQGDDGEIEPITWLVLQRKADYLLVFSERGLDCQPYNTDDISIDWENCTLRYWLNSEFYDKAFNKQERECILQTKIVNNACPKTEDRVFLLSIDEAESLLANMLPAKPTEYAIKNGVYAPNILDGCCQGWWLRSRGINSGYAAYVWGNGGISDGSLDYGITRNDFAVRPALKLAL